LLRGIRGATTVDSNEKKQIIARVSELLLAIVGKNNLSTKDIGAVIFSSTPDLDAAFPAAGARNIGWDEVPLFGAVEIESPGAPAKCIRVLILWNTDLCQSEIQHVYLHDSVVLRSFN
jgi:chorismate mutase